MNMQEELHVLVEKSGLSGSEEPIAVLLCSKLKTLGLEAKIDSFGNVHGRYRVTNNKAKTLLLEAHMDQIGFMVSDIDENGFLKFINLGGVDERILSGMTVSVLSNPPITGIIGCFADEANEENKKNPPIDAYRIHVGLNPEEAKKKIRPGDFVQMLGASVPLLNGRISGCAMDNRAGILAILDSLEKTIKQTPVYHIEVLFSTQEELGLHGAYTGVEANQIDAAIAIDVTHGTTQDTKEETGVFPLGSGAVICRGPNFHYDYTKQLINLAKEKDIPYEIEVAGGSSGTTAWAIQTIGDGIPVMLISIPLRYMHTNVETLDICDIKATSDLLQSVMTGGISLA